MPRKKEKKEKKHSKKNKVSAKATNNVHVEIHHHSKKRGKSAPRAPQFIPMGGGSTIVNNIPSPDFPNLQLMHQQASYENIIKNLAAEIQAVKLSVPGANQEVITNHAQDIKNEIDNTVKPTVKLNIPGTDVTTQIATGTESLPLMNHNLAFSISGLTTPTNELNTLEDLTGKLRASDMMKMRFLDQGGNEEHTYIPHHEEIAALEIAKANAFPDKVKRPMLINTALDYARSVNDVPLLAKATQENRAGKSGFYPEFEKMLNEKTTDFVNTMYEEPIIKQTSTGSDEPFAFMRRVN